MRKHIFIILILFFVFSLPLLDLLHPGLPVTHDGQDHVARIANFYQSLQEGNLIPRWASNLNWGYGHPILMFLYPLPSYGASIIHKTGVSFVDSFKLILAIAYILSGFSMYLWISSIYGKKAGVIASLMYQFAPYRFVDLYVRGALGEHVAFIFLPICCYGIYLLTKNYSKGFFVTALSIFGLLLSHNAVSLMFLPVFFLYIFYIWYFQKRNTQFLFYCFMAVFIGFSMSSFFLIPAYLEGKYTLRDIVTGTEILSRFVSWKDFFYSPWNYGGGNAFTKEIGIMAILATSFAFLVSIKEKNRQEKIFLLGFVILTISSLFCMTSFSSFLWTNIHIIQKFQFPWRLLTITVFTTSILSGVLIKYINQKLVYIVLSLCALFIVSISYPMWHAKEYKVYSETFFTDVYKGTTDTGESSPIWSIRFMEHTPNKAVEVISGNAMITSISRSSTKRIYTIDAVTISQIVENTLYFPGWVILVDNKPVPVEFQNPQHRGLMTYWVDAGAHTITVLFKSTRIRTFSEYFSVLSILFFISFAWWLEKKQYE